MQNHNQKREYQRLAHKTKIRVTDPSGFKEHYFTRDFSDSGLFVFCDKEPMPVPYSIMKIQALDVADAIIQTVRVVRIEPGVGFAGVFVGEE